MVERHSDKMEVEGSIPSSPTMKIKYVWLNGKIIPYSKGNFSLLNHSMHYGSAVFEGIRAYNTKEGLAVFRLEDHIKRLFYSAKVMGFKSLWKKEEVILAIKNLIKKNNLKDCYIRPIFFYGEKMGLLPLDAPVNLYIAAWPWGKYLEKKMVSLKVSSFRRIHPLSSFISAKISGHYSNSIIASMEARKKGYDEALLLDYNSNIAEGPGENIFFKKEKELHTPKEGSILPGITRNSVMKIGKDMGYNLLEKEIKLKDLSKYDEAFFTGTAVEINGISKIDDVVFSKEEGDLTKEIKDIYYRVVRGEIKKYKRWLNYV